MHKSRIALLLINICIRSLNFFEALNIQGLEVGESESWKEVGIVIITTRQLRWMAGRNDW